MHAFPDFDVLQQKPRFSSGPDADISDTVKQRGRKSPEDQLVVIEGDFGKHRPDPPEDMTDRQKEIWRAIVNDEPVHAFATAGTRAMLADYCRCLEMIEWIATCVNTFKVEWMKTRDGLKRISDLSKLRAREVDMHKRLATSLRLTNQSRYSRWQAATASANTARGPKPWER
jgi:hypothetical protein